MNRTHRNLTLFTLKLAFSGFLLWLVLQRVHPDEILARIRNFNWKYSVVVLFLWTFNLCLASWRWSILSLRLIPLGQAFRYTWIGFFFGSILPGAISGDIAKGVSLGMKDKSHGADRLTASIFLDKLVGVFTLLLFFGFAAGWLLFHDASLFGQLKHLMVAGLIASVACIAGLLFGWSIIGSPQVTSWLAHLPFAPLRRYVQWVFKAFEPYQHERRAIFQAMGLAVIMHSVVILVYWIMFVSVSAGASLIFAAVFYPLISFVLMVPLSISGIGMRDAFAAVIFSSFGLQPDAGVAVSWLLLALNAPIVLVGAIIQAAEFFRRGNQPDNIQP